MGKAWAELMERLGYTRYVARAATGVRLSSTRWACRAIRPMQETNIYYSESTPNVYEIQYFCWSLAI